jgi:alpha-beta hydrolase superfamily lysophospholipase
VELQTRDGIKLHVRDWPLAPGVARRGAALVVHGLGEHSGRYAHVAKVLNDAGVVVRSYDHRGFGQSGGRRAVLAHADALLDDAKLMFDRLAADAGAAGDRAPPFLIGHSMGGALAARAVTGGWIRPRGLVLSSPGLKTHLPALAQRAIRIGARLAPNFMRDHGLPLEKISHDAEVLIEAQDDPLNHRMATPRLIAFILDAGVQARRDAAKLAVPTLLLVAGDDHLVDPMGSREFAEAAPKELVTLRWYDGLYHEIFNEREPDRARVLRDLRDWIVRQSGGG